MNQDLLERYSFLWSEVRLLIASVALLLGGVPPVWYFIRVPALFGIISPALTLCWILSGLASAYLAYRWFTGGQTLFGGKDTKDQVAFFVMVVSGVNLGLTGLIGKNIGMSISSNYIIFIVVAAAYLVSAVYLYTRWSASGKKIF